MDYQQELAFSLAYDNGNVDILDQLLYLLSLYFKNKNEPSMMLAIDDLTNLHHAKRNAN